MFCLCVCMCTMYAQCPQRPEGDIFPGTGVTEGCELPGGCWNQTWVPCKSSHWSSPLSSLSGLCLIFLFVCFVVFLDRVSLCRMASHLTQSSCLYHPSIGITDVHTRMPGLELLHRSGLLRGRACALDFSTHYE